MSFTAGPWTYNPSYPFNVRGSDGLDVALVVVAHGVRGAAEQHANGRLITAAPELLEFARWLVKNLPDPHGECPFTACLACEAHGKAAGLIAKAEGR